MTKEQVTKVNPKLSKVLEYQNKVKKTVKTIADIEAAIEVQQAIIDAANSFESGLPHLHTRRENLLAEMITGGASNEELVALDEEIIVEKKRHDNHAENTSQTVPDAKQSIIGLSRKLAGTVTDFDTLKSEKSIVIGAFLQAEAECLGEEYLQLMKELMVKYRLLLAYGPLLRKVDGGRIEPWAGGITIPLFHGLKAHQGLDTLSTPGEISEVVKARTYPEYAIGAVNEEKARITELGVNW